MSKKGYARGWKHDEFHSFDELAETPDGAAGEGDTVYHFEAVEVDELAEAWSPDRLIEDLEEYMLDNGLLGDSSIEDWYDFEGDLGEALHEAITKTLREKITNVKWYHVTEVKDGQ